MSRRLPCEQSTIVSSFRRYWERYSYAYRYTLIKARTFRCIYNLLTLSNYSGQLTIKYKLRSILNELSCEILKPWSERRLNDDRNVFVWEYRIGRSSYWFLHSKSNLLGHQHNLISHPALQKAVYDYIRLQEIVSRKPPVSRLYRLVSL